VCVGNLRTIGGGEEGRHSKSSLLDGRPNFRVISRGCPHRSFRIRLRTGACGGELACSTCHLIFPQDVYDTLPPMEDDEVDMLDLAFEVTETSRLGCQIKVRKDMAGMKVRAWHHTAMLQGAFSSSCWTGSGSQFSTLLLQITRWVLCALVLPA
jgi:ferredoxin